jgi:hypothetical protein
MKPVSHLHNCSRCLAELICACDNRKKSVQCIACEPLASAVIPASASRNFLFAMKSLERAKERMGRAA